MKSYDLIIIGAGPAGLTAALYAVRSGLKTALISKSIGGTANSILKIENWPGYSGTGAGLMKQFFDQLRNYKELEIITKDVEKIAKEKNKFLVHTKKENYECKTIILATGTERKKMNIPGEKEFLGKGVSYCVTCDAFFFKDKNVAVIGGSDCAATSALTLADIAKKVYVLYRGEHLRCEELTEKGLEHKKNVEIFYDAIPLKIHGKEKVNELEILHKGKKQKLKIDGVFVEIGAVPLAEFSKELKLDIDENGYIEVNEDMETSVSGIFAAGDITSHKLKQVIVASSQGAIASKAVHNFLKNNNI